MRACRKPFLLFLSTKPQHQHRTLPRRRTGHFKRHAERNRQQKIYRGVFRRGVVRSCSVMVEEYLTIAEWFLTTPRRKNRAIFTQNALESLLLLQPWYDHSLQRHIRLEPPSDRLVKGIWRWHAKDDIYKTFWTCRLNNFSVILNSFFFRFQHFCSNKSNLLLLLKK